MKSIYTYKDAEWVDLKKPTDKEIKEVADAHKVDESVAVDLVSPSMRHTVTFGDKHAYVVLHFPAFKDADTGDAAYELDFIIGKDYLITVHYGDISAIQHFSKIVESGAIEDVSGHGRDVLFFGLLKTLIADLDEKLTKIDHWVRDLEKNMFAGKEKITIFEISEASRHLVDFRKITAVYPDSFRELALQGGEMFGKAFKTHAEETLESFNRVGSKLETLATAVKELRDTNNAILTTKQNETMKLLTTVTIVATIIVGVALVWVGLLAVE